jgi:hypothetical protein
MSAAALSSGAGGGNPIIMEDAHSRSDNFWSLTAVDGMAAEDYATFAEMVKSADAVIVGQIVSVTKGRESVADAALIGDPDVGDRAMARFAKVTIEIEQIIGGSLYPLGRLIDMEVYLPREDTLPLLEASIPIERALFALRNKGPEDSIDFYRFVNDEQGLIRDFGGSAHLLAHDLPVGFTELEGQTFSQSIREAREARD